MADDKRHIYKSNFSIQKMLEMGTEDARRYFITTFFVPLAYNKWETDPSNYAVLHLCKNATGIALPVLTMTNFKGSDESNDMPWPGEAALIKDNVIEDELQKRTFGDNLDYIELSKAIIYAFSDCFYEGKVVSIRNLPLVATVHRVGASYKLNVLVKSQVTIKHKGALLSWAVDGENALVLSEKYGRWYNSLTGEWEALCVEGDAKECDRCKVIRKSSQSKNAYDE